MKNTKGLVALALLSAALCHAQPVEARAVYRSAQQAGYPPIKDAAGRIYYIVVLDPKLQAQFPDHADPHASDRFDPRHNNRARNMVRSYEVRYGFEHVSMTSWVGNTFSAYLDAGQIARLQHDPHVSLISEVIPGTFSEAYPVANSQATNLPGILPEQTEDYSYGRRAVNGVSVNAATGPTVYIIDSGVGYHQDLASVVARFNPNSPSVVGCYAHGTHVAGIIGATFGNGGTAGVAAGVKMVSVSVVPGTNSTANCANGQFTSTNIAAALDVVGQQFANQVVSETQVPGAVAKVGVVNLSLNSPDFNLVVDNNPDPDIPDDDQVNGQNLVQPGVLRAMMKCLSVPYAQAGGCPNHPTGYPGMVITQSSGNRAQQACDFAYGNQAAGQPGPDGASTNDGIFVVGAVNSSSEPYYGFDNGSYASGGYGSNWGPCVDIWAPGQVIKSTWGGGLGPQSGNSTPPLHNEYVPLSGTSMAAPHVAGIAAVLISRNPTITPAQIEAEIRSLSVLSPYQNSAVYVGDVPTRTATLPPKSNRDMTGDGIGDIFWTNPSTGESVVATGAASGLSAPTYNASNTVNVEWKYVGQGDFNGDGREDVLLRHSVTGQNHLRIMNGHSIVAEGLLTTVADLNWIVAGVGDFNADGRADIIWRNTSTGLVVIWFTNSTSVFSTESQWVVETIADQNWKIVGVADFGAAGASDKGMADVLWRNFSDGTMYMWQVNGVARTKQQGFITPAVADLGWEVVGTPDLNGDGKADVFWRHNATSGGNVGQNYAWLMNGLAAPTQQSVAAVTDPLWKVATTGDYNQDGKGDVYWHKKDPAATDYTIYMWLMNGAAIASQGFLGFVSSVWTPIKR